MAETCSVLQTRWFLECTGLNMLLLMFHNVLVWCVSVCVYRCKFFVSFWGERLHFQKMNANLYFKFCLLLLVACHCWSFKVQEELRALQGNKKRHLSTFLDLLPAAFQVWANAKT